jgi:putative FmdB family regulatory protein
MPLYEYLCRSCEHRFERIEKPSAMHDGVCPECGGAADRLLGAPALKFKGAGWYVTDYGKGNGDRASSAPAATKAESADAGSTKEASPGKTSSSPAGSKVA